MMADRKCVHKNGTVKRKIRLEKGLRLVGNKAKKTRFLYK